MRIKMTMSSSKVLYINVYFAYFVVNFVFCVLIYLCTRVLASLMTEMHDTIIGALITVLSIFILPFPACLCAISIGIGAGSGPEY